MQTKGTETPLVKRLFWDIETCPNIVLSWRVGPKVSLDPENILKERAIICIGYKWQHEPQAKVMTWDKKQSDRAMLERFLKLANKADELVAHNGDSFDMPWFLTRCAFHGLHTFPRYKTTDTLQWAKRRFYFNSNKLNYLAQYFGMGAKIKTEFGLWKAVTLDKDPAALRRMAAYCARDVELLQKVYERIAPMAPIKTHAGVLHGGGKWTCPACASESVKKKMTRVTASGVIQHQMQCRACGRTYSISSVAFEQYKEAKRDAGK